jgi:hypothetical protein
MAVLAIEQGRTYQLFESTPRDLFHRVLEMLGDKAVLERYTEARGRYQEARGEVARQADALSTKQTELQAVLREVDRRKRWEEQRDKVQELTARLPAAKYQLSWARHADLETKIQELRTKVRRGEVERATLAEATELASNAVLGATQADATAKQVAETATLAWCDATLDVEKANDKVTPLEAMASGLPVIGTQTGGVGELLRHRENALTYPPGDVEALAALLAEVQSQPELRCQMVDTAQQEVLSKYNETAVADRIENYLQTSLEVWAHTAT